MSTQTNPSSANNTSDSANAVDGEEVNIFVAAQRGDIQLLRKLIESGQANATDVDSQNITPLHWAAINAQVPACRYLLSQGADVDAVGGDLVATPLQWAARNGYLYVIQLLVSHNADPTICDSQGYNSLHLVTHSSAIMALLYMLQQPVNVDSKDAQGHTSLMWAAYQGDSLSVDLLLRHGADPNGRDDSGLTPLHWAVVRANRSIIRKLVEQGADINAKDGENRTPRDMAVELKSLGAWKRALEEGGMNEYGVKKASPLNERNTKLAIFLLPTLFFYIIFMTLSILPWYTGILLAIAEFFGMHHIVTRVLLNHSSYSDNLNQTPYFSGIIFGSIIWVLFSWFTRFVRSETMQSHAFTNLMFALTTGLCVYNFFRAVMLDPGQCPKPSSEEELRSIIEDLASEGRLNGQTFCIQCMARKTLRSKHCRVCDRCIARSDHHCPWVWNCVGLNNHRQFVLFVSTLVVGIIIFDYLTYQFFSAIEIPSSPSSSIPIPSSCPLPSDLCYLTSKDPFLVSVSAWATLQLVWTIVLLASQLWQICKQMTTVETSNLGRWGSMGGRGDSLRGQQGALNQAGMGATIGDGATALPHPHQHKGRCDFLMKLLGFDLFTKGKAVDGLKNANRSTNPFDTGSVVGNCRDFWTTGKELGVDYEKLYDVPMEGFREAKRIRQMEDHAGERIGLSGADDLEGHPSAGAAKRSAGVGKGLFGMMGMGSGSSRSGYEPVSQA